MILSNFSLDTRIDEWGGAVIMDFIYLFTGEKIGEGANRKVYAFRGDPTKVIKVETTSTFQNVLEIEAWYHLKNTKWAKWFAPILDRSACGHVIIQARTTPVTEIPKRIPHFMTDVNVTQFGKLKGRVVIHDYGYLTCIPQALRNGKLKKAKEGSWSK